MANDSRCKKCKYGVLLLGSQKKQGYCACFYIVLAKKGRRPCPPNEQCTVFEEMKGRRNWDIFS